MRQALAMKEMEKEAAAKKRGRYFLRLSVLRFFFGGVLGLGGWFLAFESHPSHSLFSALHTPLFPPLCSSSYHAHTLTPPGSRKT